MTASRSDLFTLQCRHSIDDILMEFGYMYQETHTRSRGIALEFRNDSKRCFVVCEGKTVYMDVILPCSGNEFCRVSINQALWFNGVKSISQSASVAGQLTVLASELKQCCGAILTGDLLCLDSRYCFKMSLKECDEYIAAQTGQRL